MDRVVCNYMDGLISIIIPVYNHSEHLSEVLDALNKQTYTNIEVIVVDDGSVPPLESSHFSSFHFPLRFLRQENKGACAARNFGFAHSKGEYILFLDADVIASPEMLQQLFEGLEKDTSASYAYSDHYHGFKRFVARGFDGEALKKNNYITTMSLIRRKDTVAWDESIRRFQDWDVWLTMLEAGKHGVYVPGFLWRAYPHKGGMSDGLPSYAYKFPFRYLPWFFGKVRAYERAKRIVMKKHGLI